jgi:hypothetical protein
MNARREVHEDDDLSPQQLDEIYGDQAESAVDWERMHEGEPVADDEQLDTDLIDKQCRGTWTEALTLTVSSDNVRGGFDTGSGLRCERTSGEGRPAPGCSTSPGSHSKYLCDVGEERVEPRAVAILDGRRVREELDLVNLTQRQFATRLGLRESTISAAIRGKPLATETIYRIVLGLSLTKPASVRS